MALKRHKHHIDKRYIEVSKLSSTEENWFATMREHRYLLTAVNFLVSEAIKDQLSFTDPQPFDFFQKYFINYCPISDGMGHRSALA